MPLALVPPPAGPLKRGLDELAAAAAAHRRVADDPVGALRRYQHPDDIEIAAVFASALAFGRVAAFLPVVEAVLDVADAHGGPAAWLSGWTPDRAAGLLPLQHRWVRATIFGCWPALWPAFGMGAASGSGWLRPGHRPTLTSPRRWSG